MRITTAIAAGALVLSFCSASPAPDSSKYVLHEKRATGVYETTAKVARRSRLGANSVIPVRIGLTQSDLHLGYDHVMDVSHPESPNYGKHWTAEQVNRVFAPTAETVQAVRDWLISTGLDADRIKVSDNKGWLGFEASLPEVEYLFRTQYFEHEHPHDDKYTIGCDEYYLPEHLQKHIDYVTPGVKHQVYKRRTTSNLRKRGASRSTRRPQYIVAPPVDPPTAPTIGNVDAKIVPVNCSSYVVTADCIRALYNMPDLNIDRSISSTNTLGIFESLQQSYSQDDLNKWFAGYAPYIPQGTAPEFSSVDGGIGPVPAADSGGEAMLDITLAYGIIYPQTINFYSVDDPYWAYYSVGWMDTFLDAIDGSFCTYSAFGQKGNNDTIDPVYPDPRQGGYKGPLECGVYAPPKVLSVSYGDGESNLPVNYIKRQCSEWMKLALQGTTAVFSSGDYGVSTYPGSYNTSNGCLGPNHDIFSPSVWAECPYILSVGATTIRVNVSGYSSNPEQAVYAQFTGETYPYTSGSGFSNIFSRPEYQNEAVKTYFQTADPGYPHYSTTNGKNIGANGGLYNRGGRAYPDISANGAWWHLYLNGTLYRYGGTSMSAPIVASMLNLINEARIKAGKSTVGFVHPTFYGHPEAFYDITIGANQGCGKEFAFNCTVGWDPPTGLGTPNFAKLKDIFMSLP